MIGLILAAGRGTRLGEISEHCNKSMLLHNGKPILQYNLELLADLNTVKIEKVLIVVNYRREQIMDFFGSKFRGIDIEYIIQENLNGIVGAILTASDLIRADDFIMMLGDEYLKNPRLNAMVNFFYGESLDACCGVIKVDDLNLIKNTYTMNFNESEGGYLTRIVEKPTEFYNDFSGTGYCIYSNKMLNFARITPYNQLRKQIEMGNWMQVAINHGSKLKPYIIADKAININSPDDLNLLKIT